MLTPPPNADPQRPNAAMLAWAYSLGIFPMADEPTGDIEWFRPDPRGVIPLDTFHVPKNLARAVRQQPFEIRTDTAFDAVMRACADVPRDHEDGTWIDDRLIRAYVELHDQGRAHSVEAWLDGQLVGGLYGVHLGAAFMGESMFTRPGLGGTNASKICLVHLVERLNANGFQLLDTQFWNPHLDQFGCEEIPLAEYLARLESALNVEARWA